MTDIIGYIELPPEVVGKVLPIGKTGTTFTPDVSVDGDISWTNDGHLTNPDTVNVMGQPTAIKIGDVPYERIDGVVTLPEYPVNTDTKYSAGDGIDQNGTVFSLGAHNHTLSEVTDFDATDFADAIHEHVMADITDLEYEDTKYSAGDNIEIDGDNKISATDTKYTAGTGLTLTGTEFSSDITQTTVVDNLTSTETGQALSANQGKVLKGLIDALPEENTEYDVFTADADGLVPKSELNTDKFLKGDGTWGVPVDEGSTYTAGDNIAISDTNVISATDTTYGVVSTTASGLAPKVTDTAKFLKGDGTWAVPAGETYTAGSNIEIDENNEISAIDTKYTAGTNIAITGNTISATDTVVDISGKADKTYVDNKVKTDVPINAEFTDTVTTINGKTGAISKADITALGIPAQDTVVDISGKADTTYVDGKVKTDVPVGAKFTDTVYTHPASHPASMITGLPTSLPASGGNADTVGEFTVGVNVPAGAVFTDTKTTINGKTGEISKDDIVALGIPAQDTVVDITGKQDKLIAGTNIAITGNTISATDTVVDISGKADKTYVDNKVKTDVPINAEFTDTITTINGNTGVISKADITALGIPAQDTVYTHPTGTNPHGTTKSDVGLGNVTNDKQMPISGGVLENYREKLVTLSGTSTAINLSLGNVFTHTLSGNTTYTITNAVSGQAHSFTLIVNMGTTARTLTFPASVKWQGGEIPDLTTASKTYILTFMTVDGGTTWLGMFGGEF